MQSSATLTACLFCLLTSSANMKVKCWMRTTWFFCLSLVICCTSLVSLRICNTKAYNNQQEQCNQVHGLLNEKLLKANKWIASPTKVTFVNYLTSQLQTEQMWTFETTNIWANIQLPSLKPKKCWGKGLDTKKTKEFLEKYEEKCMKNTELVVCLLPYAI